MSDALCTHLDSGFLAHGLALHASLRRQAPEADLWIFCLDDAAHDALAALRLERVTLVRLSELETPALLAAKANRSWGEYCWTLTPFLPSHVLARGPYSRVTYIDADCFLFSPPARLWAELEAAGREVLVTPHAYAPEYAYNAGPKGLHCVQFVPFTRGPGAERVLADWQARCLEWCHDRVEPGRFGDQKYLDAWETDFPGVVHVLTRPELTLAPWNAVAQPADAPCLYHFHGYRVHRRSLALGNAGYRIPARVRPLYAAYSAEIARALDRLADAGHQPQFTPRPSAVRDRLQCLRLRLRGRLLYERLPRARFLDGAPGTQC